MSPQPDHHHLSLTTDQQVIICGISKLRDIDVKFIWERKESSLCINMDQFLKSSLTAIRLLSLPSKLLSKLTVDGTSETQTESMNRKRTTKLHAKKPTKKDANQ